MTLQMTMEATPQYPEVILAKGKEKRLRNGHLWIFSNELTPSANRPGAGEIVAVKTSENRFSGVGFYHPNSLIAVRLLSRRSATIDRAFFTARLQRALQAREHLAETTEAVRLVYAESDGLPGLIVDRFAEGLVLQILSAGMDKQRDIVVDVLRELLDPHFLIMRNDHHMREREGLTQGKQFLMGGNTEMPVTVTENSLSYLVDPLDGQKTGFYIDQRDNRMVFRRFVRPGDRVLDAFCHSAGFAMHAALAGAGEVLAIDNSESVLEYASKNIRQNGLEHAVSTRKADLMKWLPDAAEGGKERFNVINLDPPNFAANRKSVGPALRGYRKLHRAALKMIEPGGILATASCSHHITEEAFLDSVARASRDSRRRVQMVCRSGHAPDHPVLPEMPETGYLKFFIFRVVDID